MVGISRLDVIGRLWRIRVGLHRGRDVPRAGAPAQDASLTFAFLSSATTDGSFLRDPAASLVGLCSLHTGVNQRLFCRRAIAVDTNCLRDRRMDFVCTDFAGALSALVRTKACRRTLYYRI